MEIAVTIWDNKISPVFDCARQFLLLKVEDGVLKRHIRYLVETSPYITLDRLQKEEQVEMLLCGAICEKGIQRIQNEGIEIIPFLSGDVEEIVDRFIAGKALQQFAMPGCHWQCCRRRRAKALCPKGKDAHLR